jgi:uncharacterized protein (DUF2267 family)
MNSASKGDWDSSLKYFLPGIDADSSLHGVFSALGGNLCAEATAELKSALKKDIDRCRKESTVKQPDILKDDFYLALSKFVEVNGRDIFDDNSFYSRFSDYLNGEHKNDALYLKHFLELRIHREIIENGNIEEIRKHAAEKISALTVFRKNDPCRMVDILSRIFL